MQFELRSAANPMPYRLTDQIQRLAQRANVQEGVCFVSVQGSGVALLSVECPEGQEAPVNQVISEALSLSRLPDFLSNFLGDTLQIPVVRGQLLRATWQEFFLVDFVEVPRLHHLSVHVIAS